MYIPFDFNWDFIWGMTFGFFLGIILALLVDHFVEAKLERFQFIIKPKGRRKKS